MIRKIKNDTIRGLFLSCFDVRMSRMYPVFLLFWIIVGVYIFAAVVVALSQVYPGRNVNTGLFSKPVNEVTNIRPIGSLKKAALNFCYCTMLQAQSLRQISLQITPPLTCLRKFLKNLRPAVFHSTRKQPLRDVLKIAVLKCSTILRKMSVLKAIFSKIIGRKPKTLL